MASEGINLQYFEASSKDGGFTEAEENFFKTYENARSLFPFLKKEHRAAFNKMPTVELQKVFLDTVYDYISQTKELITDGMTGLFRREMMFKYVEIKMKGKSLDEIKKMPLTIAAADFAGLGYFNKQSHDAGDAALKVASEPMKDIMKSNNGVGFRYGGDEFTFVINAPKKQATDAGNEMRKKLLGIDTSDPEQMKGYSFELPLRIDIGYAELSEGADALMQICKEIPGDEICADDNDIRNNQIIDLTYQIADQRSGFIKNISLLYFLKEKFKAMGDSSDFARIFDFAVMKKQLKLEQVRGIFNERDEGEQTRKIFEIARSLSGIEKERQEERRQVKKNIVKQIAEGQSLESML